MCDCCFRADGACRVRLPRAHARWAFPVAAVALVLVCTFSLELQVGLTFALAVAVTVGAVWASWVAPAASAAGGSDGPAPPALMQASGGYDLVPTSSSAEHQSAAASGSAVVPVATSVPPVSEPVAAAAGAAVAAASAAPAVPTAPTAPRLVYIDNIKTVLTAIVVLHHVFGAFAGGGSLGLSVGNFANALQPALLWLQIMDQSWFMCAFFFFAGLVAPASLRRKGARGFMIDRLRRLGVPFAIYFWCVSPALTSFVDGAVAGRASTYTPSPGPPWFLAWLLVFSACLALASDGGRAEQDFLVVARPSLVQLCGVGAGLGALQFVEMLFLPGLLLMPITFGSFPLDCAFFFAGVLAARNGWLSEEAQRAAQGERREGEDAAAGVIAFAVANAAVIGAASAGLVGGLLSVNGCDQWPSRGDPGLGTLLAILVLCVCGGAYAAAALVAALDLFRRHLDAHTPLSAFLARHAFAAYLVHPVAVVPLTGAFIAVARARTGNADSFNFPVSGAVDFSDCVGDGAATFLLAGFAVVSALSLPLTLALAVVARKLPVLRDLL